MLLCILQPNLKKNTEKIYKKYYIFFYKIQSGKL